MTLAQTSVVVARIATIPALSAKTYKLVAPRDGAGKLPAAPYVVVQPSDGTATQERLTGGKNTGHPRYVFHAVGASYDNAQTVLELVKAKFIDSDGFGLPIVVPNEKSRNVRWESAGPVQVDNDVTPPIIYATGELTWDADPA